MIPNFNMLIPLSLTATAVTGCAYWYFHSTSFTNEIGPWNFEIYGLFNGKKKVARGQLFKSLIIVEEQR